MSSRCTTARLVLHNFINSTSTPKMLELLEPVFYVLYSMLSLFFYQTVVGDRVHFPDSIVVQYPGYATRFSALRFNFGAGILCGGDF